jgi:hypothetical protein
MHLISRYKGFAKKRLREMLSCVNMVVEILQHLLWSPAPRRHSLSGTVHRLKWPKLWEDSLQILRAIAWSLLRCLKQILRPDIGIRLPLAGQRCGLF